MQRQTDDGTQRAYTVSRTTLTPLARRNPRGSDDLPVSFPGKTQAGTEWNRGHDTLPSLSGQSRPQDLSSPSSATDLPQTGDSSSPSSAYNLHTEIFTSSTSSSSQLHNEDFFSPSSFNGQPPDDDAAMVSPMNSSFFCNEGTPPTTTHLNEGTLSPNGAHGASIPSEKSTPALITSDRHRTTARAPRPRGVCLAEQSLDVQPGVIGSPDDSLGSPDDDNVTITTELPDNAGIHSYQSVDLRPLPYVLQTRERAQNSTISSASSSRSSDTPRQMDPAQATLPHSDWNPAGTRMFRRTLYRHTSGRNTSTQETELDNYPTGLQLFAEISSLQSPRIMTRPQTLLDSSAVEDNRSETLIFWRVWAGLSVIFLFTVVWAMLYIGMVHLYRINQNDPRCAFTYSPWFTSKMAEARVADNTSSMPFLLVWGIFSHLLPMIRSIRVYVATLTSRTLNFLIHLFLYKTNIPWYVMMCISVIQWHYCRTNVSPLCSKAFVDATFIFSVYSTFYVIVALVALHTVVSFWVTQQGLRDRRIEFHARVTELEDQIQRARALNDGPPIVQMAGILRVLFSTERPVSRGAPGLVDKLNSITWPALQLADASETECSICFIGFDEGLQIIRCPCDHYFHKKCLACWFEMADTCPLCRKSCRIPEERHEQNYPVPSLSSQPPRASAAIISQRPRH